MYNRRRLLMCDGLKFFILYDGILHGYKFLKNMTWRDFVSSRYNDGNFVINGTDVLFCEHKVSLNDVAVNTTEPINGAIPYGVIIANYIFKEGVGLEGCTYYGNESDMVTVNTSYIKVTGETAKVSGVIVDAT